MSRAALAILNELSMPSSANPLPDHQLEERISGFVATLMAARKVRRDLALVSNTVLAATPVTADQRSLATFLGSRGGRNREQLKFILALLNHAPFSKAPSLTLPEHGEEFQFEDEQAPGLGLAATNRQIAVSFPDAHWDKPILSVERLWAEERADEVTIDSETLDVTHAASAEHVAQHDHFIRHLTFPRAITGLALWDQRDALYPHLAFLPRVEDQLGALASGSTTLKSVHVRLNELEVATAAWSPGSSPHPAWKSLVTPESEQRKRLCEFPDLDGVTRCFDLHARFTPGAGRIHFRTEVQGETQQLVIAHVGMKIDS